MRRQYPRSSLSRPTVMLTLPINFPIRPAGSRARACSALVAAALEYLERLASATLTRS